MRVLVACEFSGRVREAFNRNGHDAWSCDLIDTEIPGKHYKCDVIDILDLGWDLMVAHPPCTYLCNSGVKWLSLQGDRFDKMVQGANFFKELLDCDIPSIAIENPIIHRYAVSIIGRRHDQIIQPYEFGHPESKRTCLWLKNLPKLQPTNNVYEEFKALPKKLQNKAHLLPDSKGRSRLRSLTFTGIAQAMADQWGVI